MLAKTNLKNVGILSGFNIQEIRKNDWRMITKSGILHLQKAFDGYIFSDNTSFIEDFLSCMYEKEYTSILFGGLGLGVAPFICRLFCTKIDVIEKDVDVIDLVNTAGYLTPNINVINDDIFNYQPQQKYDFIMIDIWQTKNAPFDTEVQTLTQKYTQFLNENGTLCFPLL